MINKNTVLLIVPPRIMNIDRDIGSDQLTPPGGLAYISGYLKSRGLNVAAIDAQAERLTPTGLAYRIRSCAPAVVGIGIHCSVQLSEAAAAASVIKRFLPGTPVVVGGSHPSAVPENILEENTCFDFAVCGEGEKTMYELSLRLLSHDSCEDVDGIAMRRKTGEIVVNPLRRYIEDLDSLPFPAFELFPLNKYKPYFKPAGKNLELPVTTARGCPSRCFFCYQPMSENVRTRSVDNVMAELHYLTGRFKINQVLFTDDTFTLDQERIREFCERMQKEGLHKKIRWLCASRVDIISQELLRIMRAAGCACVTYGVESGNQQILDKIGKRISLAQARDAVRWTKEAGITADVNFILGLPYENEKTVRDSLNFIIELDPDFVNVALLAVFPGTRAREMTQAGIGGLRFINKDWNKAGRIVGNMTELEQLPRAKLEAYQTEAYMKFYLRPSKIGNLFKKVSWRSMLHYGRHQLHTLLPYFSRRIR